MVNELVPIGPERDQCGRRLGERKLSKLHTAPQANMLLGWAAVSKKHFLRTTLGIKKFEFCTAPLSTVWCYIAEGKQEHTQFRVT